MLMIHWAGRKFFKVIPRIDWDIITFKEGLWYFSIKWLGVQSTIYGIAASDVIVKNFNYFSKQK